MSVLAEFRQHRRRRRIGEIEWFDVAYKVYLVGLGGALAVLALSDVIGDEPLARTAVATAAQRGPSVVGLIAGVTIAVCCRAGLSGGPLALEEPDIHYLLDAPVDRREVLRPPTLQRMRAVAFGWCVAGMIVGQLAARRLPGSTASWAISGGVAGALLGALSVSVTVVVHVYRWRWSPGVAWTLVCGQACAAGGLIEFGPFDAFGGLAMWGWRQHVVELLAVVVGVSAVGCALWCCHRLRPEALERRSALVRQLRFAATMQDLRTVTLLRRQLTHEHLRSHPWFQLPRSLPRVHRRAWVGFSRFPARRLLRMAALATGGALCHVGIVRGVTPLVVGAAACAFLLGTDLIEPFAQELDHPDLSAGYPMSVGRLHQRLVVASLGAAVPFGLLGAIVAIGVERCVAAPFLIAIPATLIGVSAGAGSAAQSVNTSLRAGAGLMMPPEVAGLSQAIRALWPLAVAALGTIPTLAARHSTPSSALGSVARGALGVAAAVVISVWWIERRSALRAWFQRTVSEGRREAGLEPLT